MKFAWNFFPRWRSNSVGGEIAPKEMTKMQSHAASAALFRSAKCSPRRAAGLALLFVLALALGLSRPPLAMDRGGYSMEVLVDGVPLPEYEARGTSYVCALNGREYSVRLQNHTGERVAFALSVDGMNSIDAKSGTAREASKWILGPYETVVLDGWQTSSSTSRRFYFTTERKSYGSWLGNTRNLGVVSAAVFRERRPEPPPICRDGFRGPYPCPPGRIAPGGAPAPGGRPLRGAVGSVEDDSRLSDAYPQSKSEGTPTASAKQPGAGGSGANADRQKAADKEIEPSQDAGVETLREEGRHAADSLEGEGKDSRWRHDAMKKRALSDELAATGIGREMAHEVQRVAFDHESSPAAVMEVRYEYRDALVRLGVLLRVPDEDALARRETAHGFEDGGYAPDPYRPRRRR